MIHDPRPTNPSYDDGLPPPEAFGEAPPPLPPEALPDHVIVGGIDEAGLGPKLGPLVICCVLLRLPATKKDTPIWELAPRAVARVGEDGRGRLTVGDSKQVYKSGDTLAGLELPALAAYHAAHGSLPLDFARWLADTTLLSPDDLREAPWDREFAPAIPCEVGARAVADHACALNEELAAHDTRLVGFRCKVLTAAAFNRALDQCGNKSVLLFLATAELVRLVLARYPRAFLNLDAQGGRKRYGMLLKQSFPRATIRGFGESALQSRYRIEDGAHAVDLCFGVRSDQESFPVALASQVAKYQRERFMEGFNAFWRGHVSGLKRTAGYPQDASRFLEAIEPARRALGIDRALIERQR